MDKAKQEKLGDELYQALSTQSTLTPFTEREADITIDDAYYLSLIHI